MRKSICIFLMAAAALTSCTKAPIDGSEDINLHLPRYIYFDATAATKAPLVTNLTGKDFSVIGFNFGSNWDTYKATGTPMSEFYKTKVTESGGIFTYSPLVNWDATKKYTFFAYYPSETVNSTATGVTVEGTQSTANTPKITYTISGAARSDQSKLYDVMTAMVKDTDNSSDGTVNFHFYHRLYCIEVVAGTTMTRL